MSKLYGTISADRGTATRCSTQEITAAAQSWDGSASVSLWYASDGTLMCDVSTGKGSTACPRHTVFSGPFSELAEKGLN